MKAYFECDVCHKKFTTEEDALACEAKHREEEEKAKRLEAEKEQRGKAINTLLEEYVKDYHEIPTISIKGIGRINNILDFFTL